MQTLVPQQLDEQRDALLLVEQRGVPLEPQPERQEQVHEREAVRERGPPLVEQQGALARRRDEQAEQNEVVACGRLPSG